MQAMQNTENILRDLTRVAKQAIVCLPQRFGYWQNLQIGLFGHMPVSERMPYQWYNTPNILVYAARFRPIVRQALSAYWNAA